MLDGLMGDMTLYHVSPKSRRQSIQGKGLKALTWNGIALVLCLTTADNLDWLIPHVAQRHGTSPRAVDVWRVALDSMMVSSWSSGIWITTNDISTRNIQRVHYPSLRPVRSK